MEPESRDEMGSHASARMEGDGTRKTEKGFVVGTRSACTTSFVIGLAIASAAQGSLLNPFGNNGCDETLLGSVQHEAGNGRDGAGVFAGAGSGSNMLNVFLADLSNSASGMSNTGLALTLIRNGDVDLCSEYSASVSITSMFDVGEDGSFSAGVSEIFAVGEGVSIVDGFIRRTGNRVDSGSVDPTTGTTQGFAITNLQPVDDGELSLAFLSLGGSIQAVGLFNDDDHTSESSYYSPSNLGIGPALIVPLPPPLGLALAGLIGVVWMRRRRIC